MNKGAALAALTGLLVVFIALGAVDPVIERAPSRCGENHPPLTQPEWAMVSRAILTAPRWDTTRRLRHAARHFLRKHVR